MHECIQNIVKFVGHYHVVTHVDIAFLQVFLLEQFGTLSLKPTQYHIVKMVEVEENEQIVEILDRLYQSKAQILSGFK